MSAINERFLKEVNSYSIDELEEIRETQQDLYTSEEMEAICTVIREKKHMIEQEHLSKLPREIECPKCDGPNLFENDICQFCGHKINKERYFNMNYTEDEEENEEENEQTSGYGFQYLVSFLIPIIGFILGAILLSKENEDSCAYGKTCIILGIVSVLIYIVFVYGLLN